MKYKGYTRPDKGRHYFTDKEQAAQSKMWWQRRFDLATTQKDKTFCQKNIDHYQAEMDATS